MGQKIDEALAAMKERVSAAEPEQRPRMLLSGATAALAQAIADAKMAGMTDAQLLSFEAVQQAMDRDLGAAEAPQA